MMAALFWLGVGAISFVALYMVAEEMVRDAVDNALYTAQPAPEDADAAWDRGIDEAIALTETPLYHWLASENPGAIDSLAAAEASRADFDACDWTAPARWVE